MFFAGVRIDAEKTNNSSSVSKLLSAFPLLKALVKNGADKHTPRSGWKVMHEIPRSPHVETDERSNAMAATVVNLPCDTIGWIIASPSNDCSQ